MIAKQDELSIEAESTSQLNEKVDQLSAISDLFLTGRTQKFVPLIKSHAIYVSVTVFLFEGKLFIALGITS